MSHEPYAELAAGYALGALDPDERSQFEAHLRSRCPECEAALVEYAEGLATVAAELPQVSPPPALKARVLERIAARPEPVRQAPSRRRWGWPLLWTATLAAAAGVLAYLALTLTDVQRELAVRSHEAASLQAEAVRLRQEVGRLRDEAAGLRAEVARQRTVLALLSAPDTRVVALAGQEPSPKAHGRMWWDGDSRQGFFVTSGLPAVPSGKTYQLWVISGGKPISAGTFTVDQAGTSTLTVGPIPEATQPDVFAVTLEPAGGLPAPSGQMYLSGKTT
ncbi:MAG TPA: anti-sigma factor [Methylomirabilota bacterium]|nr:anti-sigma factor [Methylomirabilota bacterium]